MRGPALPGPEDPHQAEDTSPGRCPVSFTSSPPPTPERRAGSGNMRASTWTVCITELLRQPGDSPALILFSDQQRHASLCPLTQPRGTLHRLWSELSCPHSEGPVPFQVGERLWGHVCPLGECLRHVTWFGDAEQSRLLGQRCT